MSGYNLRNIGPCVMQKLKLESPFWFISIDAGIDSIKEKCKEMNCNYRIEEIEGGVRFHIDGCEPFDLVA